MPYIKDEERRKFEYAVSVIATQIETPGQLNYVISWLVREYLRHREPFNYETLNGIVGVLESAKAEFQRRVVASYEDAKALENGDIY